MKNRIKKFLNEMNNPQPGNPFAPPPPGSYPQQPGVPPFMHENGAPQPPPMGSTPETSFGGSPPGAPPEDYDGDGDHYRGWDFPDIPIWSGKRNNETFVVNSVSTSQSPWISFVVCTIPYVASGRAITTQMPGLPLPKVIAYWVFPVMYFETQIVQYYRPAYGYKVHDCGSDFGGDHTDEAYRKAGLTPGAPQSERIPVFHAGSKSTQMLGFHSGEMDTDVSHWSIVTVTAPEFSDLCDAVGSEVEKHLEFWLKPKWLKHPMVSQTPYVYPFQNPVVDTYCVTDDWIDE